MKWTSSTHFWNCLLSTIGISEWEFEVCQPAVYSLFRLHGCAGWPGSILVAKVNYFWFQQIKGEFCWRFITNTACVIYCSWLLCTIRIRHYTTKCFSNFNKFLPICWSFYMLVKDRTYYVNTHGRRQVGLEQNFVILSRNDLKLGMHVHCYKKQCNAPKPSG